ncbi:MFS transporter [Thermococcus sp. ES12]|uniref:MFS transporter n=1 Tax=Thermococcus sp. ES12 TaxID=1638246 RepID=UPI0014308F50|nr:MFS transporter [Thermococcus sp. ES12]NJE76975.1 MFS transporter [Thermococcus sp. ES12]
MRRVKTGSRTPYIILIAGFFAILGSTMSKSPTLPLYAQSLGLGKGEIGLVAAASTVTGIFMNFASGLLSDVYGRRKLLKMAGFVFLSAPLLYFLTDNALSLALVRVYYGVATAIFVPVSFALVSDLYPDHKGTFMGFLSSSTLVGRALAPVLAGSIIYFLGFSVVFVLCSLTGLVVFALTFRFPETGGELKRFEFTFSGELLLIGLLDAAVYMAYQGIETFLPLFYYLQDKAWLSGLILTVEIAIMAVVKPYAGYLSDRVGRIKPIVAGMTMVGLAMFVFALSESLSLVVLGAVLFSVGASISEASTKPLATEVSRLRGTALGFLESIKDIGQALGPVLIGFLGLRIGFALIGMFGILSLGLFLFARPGRKV